MSRKVEQSKIYAKWILTNRMSCNNCKKRPGEYANNRWCKKCSKSHKAELITMIPIEVFVFYVLPFLSYMDILNLSVVSKDMNKYFNENEMWKKFHMGVKSIRELPRRMKQLTWSKVPRNDTMDWTSEDLNFNRCSLAIKNNSNIPHDIYFVRDKHRGRHPATIKGKNLLPGKVFHSFTYPNHRWICVPTNDWLMKNPISNVGFVFVVNILQNVILQTSEGEKPCFVRNIEQPKVMNPIKGYYKKYANHKKEFIRLSVDPDIISKKAKKNKIAYKQTQKELKHLRCRVRALERSSADLRRHEESYEMMQNILLEGTGSAWIND